MLEQGLFWAEVVEGTKANRSFKVDNYVEVHDPEFQKEKLNGLTN